MKKIILLLTAFIFLTGFTSPDKAAKPVMWGNPNNGIQAGLYSPKTEYHVGEKIELRVKLRNVTGQPIALDPSLSKSIKIKQSGKLQSELIGSDVIVEDKIELAPGETRDFLIFHFGTKEGAGVYDFSGLLGDVQLPQIQILVK